MSKNKILVVEDERITAEDLKNTLERLGYKVTGIASSAATFYKCIQSEIPDLVLMDIFLKGVKDGIELSAEIKENLQIPVIYLTAYSDSNILERAKVTEPFGYILKPFQERELHSNIEMALHKNHMERQINHLNEILKAIRDVNQLIVRASNVKELIQKTCETLISTRAYSSAWLLILNNNGEYIDAASAGLTESFNNFIESFKSGSKPYCINQLSKSNETILAITETESCKDCPTNSTYPGKASIVSKIQYQGRIYGYLSVSMPNALADDIEELALFEEISDDLGLALNNLEQVKIKNQAEIELRNSEEKFKTLYENAPLSYQSLDNNGCFIDINPTWEKTLGYSKEEVIGKWYGDFLHPDFVDHFRVNFPAFKQRGYIHDVQFQLRKKSGEYIHVSFEGCVGYNADGTFRQTYCVFKDITEQKKFEDALTESENRFRHAFNFAATSMCLVGLDGRFLKTNSAFQQLIEYSADEISQFHFNDITHPEDLSIGMEHMNKLIKGEIETATFEKRYISKSKHVKTVQISVSLVKDELKQPRFFITHLVDLTGFKKVEQKQKETENQLRTLINSMPDIVCFKDGEGHWLVANDFDLNLFGLNGVNYIGKKDSELAEYSPFYRDSFLHCEESDEIAWQKGTLSRNDKTIPLPNGSSLVFDIIKVPDFDSKGKRKGLIVVGRDVTDRIKVEKELQMLSQAVTQSPDSIIVTNTEGIIEYVNPTLCKLTDFTAQELIGKKVDILSADNASLEEQNEMWGSLISGKEWKGTFKNKSKKGETKWQRASISPIKNTKGEITHYLSLQEDITEHMRSEIIQKILFNISKQAIETSELSQLFELIKNELNPLIDTSNFFVAIYNEQTDFLTTAYESNDDEKIESWPAEKSLTGYVVKHNKSLLIKQNDFDKLVEIGEVEQIGIASAIWLGVPLRIDGKAYGAFVIQDYNNPNAYSETELNMLEFIAGQVSLSIQRQKSILDLQQALVKAEAGDKLKTAFINNILHEIRTPLNGILGFSEMIVSPDSTPDDNEIFYSIIKKSSKRLLNTVNSYMDISMIVSGILEISHRPTNVCSLFEELHSDFKELCEHKGLELVIESTGVNNELLINTDQEKLRKVMTHLLDNAVKFTKKGLISFGCQQTQNELTFFVNDTGIGIEPHALNVIFNAFMQADISATRGYEGSGLGLTIANGLVNLLGSKLQVESVRDSGSRFYFSIPLAENTAPITPKAKESNTNQDTEKPLILVAEDDDSNFKYIEIVLKYASYEVMRAENGMEAIELCRNNKNIKLILMDIKMPIMDGFEATRHIRTFLPDLPVIALTAYVTTEDENAAIASGCNEYITKPVSKSKLLDIIGSSIAMANQ